MPKQTSTFPTINMLQRNMKQVPGIKDTSLEDKEMVVANSSIKMEATTKANGKTTRWTVGANCFMKEEN